MAYTCDPTNPVPTLGGPELTIPAGPKDQRSIETRPDVLVKGGDWKPETIVGAKEVKSWGGAVHSIPLLAERSTTSVIERIRGKPR